MWVQPLGAWSDLQHEAKSLHVYSKEVYTVVERLGPELRGDDTTDGLMEIIAAGRSVWAAIHTGGVHSTRQQEAVSEQQIGSGSRGVMLLGWLVVTGDEGAVVKETRGSLWIFFFYI